MPKPLQNESRADYLSRCIPIVLHEGTAQDGEQAAAICHSMFKKHHSNKVLSLSHTDSEATLDPTEFWKELIHVGSFKKKDFAFDVEEEDLAHWHNVGRLMLSSGIMIPVPIEHTKNPEARRGEVKDFDIRENKRGLPALYGKVKFKTPEIAQELKDSGVSIFVPANAYDKYGREFMTPIEHVAITDYPVINGLEPFEAIALSYGGPMEQQSQTNSASLRSIADILGIPAEVTDSQELLDAIMSKVSAAPPGAAAPAAGGAPGAAPPVAPPAAPAAPGAAPGGAVVAHIVKAPAAAAPAAPAPAAAPQAAAPPVAPPVAGNIIPKPDDKKKPPGGLSHNVVTALRDAREIKIDRLCESLKITPVVAKRLKERYCNEAALTLSHDTDDGFNDVIGDYTCNEPIANSGKTGVQGAALALSNGDNLENNALLRDAERRTANYN